MATPQDNYITPGRASFMGQVGNIGSSPNLAGGTINASIGGTVSNGVAPSNAASSAANAVVRTLASPSGMTPGGGGGSLAAVSISSFSPPAIQQDTKSAIAAHDTPATFTPGTSPTTFPTQNDTNIVVSGQSFTVRPNSDLPRGNSQVITPDPTGFNKTTSVTSVGGTPKQNLVGITNTLFNAGENDLTRLQNEAFNIYKSDPAQNVGGAAQDGQIPPLYTPANEPGGQGPNRPNAPGLAGGRSNSAQLPNSNG